MVAPGSASPESRTDRRSADTYTCTALGAVAGGAAPQRASTIASLDTAWPAWRARSGEHAARLADRKGDLVLGRPQPDRAEQLGVEDDDRRSVPTVNSTKSWPVTRRVAGTLGCRPPRSERIDHVWQRPVVVVKWMPFTVYPCK